jgi:hypothetical protein
VWEQIGRRTGVRGRAQTYRLAGDALRRGFHALIVQAREPWPLLRCCADAGVRVILNHRVRADERAGHFSVLVSIDDTAAVLHDPMVGPNREISKDDLLQLWTPRMFRAEIAGNVLVAIHSDPAAAPPCAECAKVMPATVVCHICAKEVALRPGAVLGCASLACDARLWSAVFCPFCDAHLPIGSR